MFVHLWFEFGVRIKHLKKTYSYAIVLSPLFLVLNILIKIMQLSSSMQTNLFHVKLHN